ncbi:MAG: winged helix-turn-helix domain-containing protein [Patescibacteria group bacterium]
MQFNTALTLEKLLRSKTRTRILWHFLENIQVRSGLRELSRIVKLQVHAVGREISLLKKANLLIEEKTPSKNFYSLNTDHPFFGEIVSLFHKSYGVGGMIMNNRDVFSGTDFLLLTSYFLFRQEKGKYDIDLLIVGAPKIDQVSIFLHNIETSLQRELLYTIITPGDFKNRKQKLDPFTWNILEKPSVLLIGKQEDLLKGVTS